jgi:hypothetical protein
VHLAAQFGHYHAIEDVVNQKEFAACVTGDSLLLCIPLLWRTLSDVPAVVHAELSQCEMHQGESNDLLTIMFTAAAASLGCCCS